MKISKIRKRLLSILPPSQEKEAVQVNNGPTTADYSNAAGPNAFIIYTLPKIGQSTMFHSCLSTFPRIPCFRTQSLFEDKETIDFLANREHEELAVITGTREPISWALSFMVQEIHRLHPEVITDFNRGQMSSADATAYMREFIDKQEAFAYYSGWFDAQVSKFIGIDLLSHPFDHKRKRMIIEQPPYRVLGFRNEDSDLWPSVLAEYFRTDRVTMKAANIALFKDYSLFYYEALMGLSYTMKVLDDLYSSRIVRAFYDDLEIEQFKERWNRPIPNYYADYLRDMLKKITSPQFQYIRDIYKKGTSMQYKRPI